VGEYPQRLLPPLTIEKYTRERDLALSALAYTLEIPDLNWLNVVEIVEGILFQTEQGESIWYKKLQ
jgi:hypothetical protein